MVAGRWETRVENDNLIEVRHYSSSQIALTLDLPQSNESHSLQHLVVAWHAQQLGIQAFCDMSSESHASADKAMPRGKSSPQS